MATTELLQARVEGQPSIYAYELPEVPSHRGLLKVGECGAGQRGQYHAEPVDELA